jgi:hypothetical protein
MVSLSLNPIQAFDIVQKNSLYYGQFEYSARFHQKEISAIRQLDHLLIDRYVGYRNAWRNRDIITDDVVHQLHVTCNHLLTLKNPFKTMISMNWLYFYTNHPEDIDYLATLSPMVKLGATTRVEVTHSRDTIGLKHPKHTFRTYVQSHKPTDHQKEFLRDFIKHNQGEIRVSQGLKDFLNPKSKRFWMMDYYFVDHNDMKIVTALALMNPKLVRKTMPIVKINN